MASTTVLAALDTGSLVSGFITLVLATVVALAVKWFPRAPREARVEDTHIYHEMNDSLRGTIATLRGELTAVRRERDQLETENDELTAENKRLRVLIDRA